MNSVVQNVYEDNVRANAYSKLEFPGTYYLAYRDLPKIIGEVTNGDIALDFGCGTGRSTRFLKNLDFQVTGIDISAPMVQEARRLDPRGNYLVVENGKFTMLQPGSYDLILSIFTFDNIASVDKRINLFVQLNKLLKPDGKFILLDSTPEIYYYEWASFTTSSFQQNLHAKSGEPVQIIMKDVEDKRPVTDIIWFEEDYSYLIQKSGFRLCDIFYPLGMPNEPYNWINEEKIPPWVIRVLSKDIRVCM